MAASTNASSAVRALALELKNFQDDPLEGIQSRLVNEENIFEWEVALFGPPDTLYQGGYFKVFNTDIYIESKST
jgi:ubiquitin-protein ligase